MKTNKHLVNVKIVSIIHLFVSAPPTNQNDTVSGNRTAYRTILALKKEQEKQKPQKTIKIPRSFCLFTSMLILPYKTSITRPKPQTSAQLVYVTQNNAGKHPVPARPGTNRLVKIFRVKTRVGSSTFLSMPAELVLTLVLVENSFKGLNCITIHTFLINELQ